MEKYSRQREEILDVLMKSYDHPTAEEVYESVRSNNSTASRGTVYRNLASLTEKRVIIKIPMKDSPDRYDYMKTEHSHATCESCGKVFDFNYNLDFQKLKRKVKSETGIEIFENTIMVSGLCNECKSNL